MVPRKGKYIVLKTDIAEAMENVEDPKEKYDLKDIYVNQLVTYCANSRDGEPMNPFPILH